MRHKIKGRKLNRTSSHRKALLVNLSSALLKHEMIKTTLPKAKELKPFTEKLMTLGKNNNVLSRQRLFSVLRDEELVNKVFTDISSRISTRNGGYIRIIKCGFRTGDKAPMAIVELVDRVLEEPVKETKSKKAPSKSAEKKSAPAKKVAAS